MVQTRSKGSVNTSMSKAIAVLQDRGNRGIRDMYGTSKKRTPLAPRSIRKRTVVPNPLHGCQARVAQLERIVAAMRAGRSKTALRARTAALRNRGNYRAMTSNLFDPKVRTRGPMYTTVGPLAYKHMWAEQLYKNSTQPPTKKRVQHIGNRRTRNASPPRREKYIKVKVGNISNTWRARYGWNSLPNSTVKTINATHFNSVRRRASN